MRASGTFPSLWHVRSTWVVLLELCEQVFAILPILIALASIRLQWTSGAVQRVTKAVIFAGFERFFSENRRTGCRGMVLRHIGFAKRIVSVEWIVADAVVEVQSAEFPQRVSIKPSLQSR